MLLGLYTLACYIKRAAVLLRHPSQVIPSSEYTEI
jgi:hypothetical protein